MTPTFKDLIALVPQVPEWRVDWPALWSLWPEFTALDTCPQDPVHHGEGDVGTHTRMVVKALVSDAKWRALPDNDRSMLFWAACLHDIGKPTTTQHEDDGRITSRGHSRIGANIARFLLWQVGAPFVWREALCGIILHHQLPFWLIERPDPRRLAIQTSWTCRPDLLCLHAHADALGRICDDQQAIIENVDLARLVFEEAGCLSAPFTFANDESRVAYFERDDRDPHFAAFEDFRCHVTVMSGLPGAGKDTWLAHHHPDLPVVSLDAIRAELNASATGNQGYVVHAAYDRAKDHLRARRDFAWNATNITAQVRSKVLRLLRDYGANIRIVYLEPAPNTLLRQNADRAAVVPQKVILKMAERLEPPTLSEAHKVDYVINGNRFV
ncbi:AAA family ATPase [Pseudaestuariivita rosea]|uniref:AAA family ATPase n=1 Tax=Pseudaestuariivita rosea TaxID=2763263 RepID=UPI001ABAB2A9|nr:AAA family ATPase [Pseudaestuariivita rosea]